MKNLQNLNLSYLVGLCPDTLHELLVNLPSLVSLDVNHCYFINSIAPLTVACNQLQKLSLAGLKLNTPETVDVIATLKNLRLATCNCKVILLVK